VDVSTVVGFSAGAGKGAPTNAALASNILEKLILNPRYRKASMPYAVASH